MVDIIIPPLSGMDRFRTSGDSRKKKVLRGRVVSARCARLKVDPLRPRKTDRPYTKALIVIVEDFKPLSSIVNREVEIRLI